MSVDLVLVIVNPNIVKGVLVLVYQNNTIRKAGYWMSRAGC